MASNDDPPSGDAPSGFEDAVEQQPDLDEENRRRFPQIPALAFHPWEGIEQPPMDDDDDEDEDEEEMDVLEDHLNHEQEQLNRLQGNTRRRFLSSAKRVSLIEQIRHIQRQLLVDLNNRREEDSNDEDDEDWEDAEAGKIRRKTEHSRTLLLDRFIQRGESRRHRDLRSTVTHRPFLHECGKL